MRAALILCALASVAHADTPVARPEAIEVDRDTTPPGQGELGFDGGAPIGNWALGVTLTELDHPIRFHTVGIKTFPVAHRETTTLGGALALGDDVIVDAKLPLSHQVGQRLIYLGDDRPLDRWVPGDVGLGARFHAMTRGPIAVFLRADLTLPTGDDYDFAGEASWTAAVMGIARAALPNDITIAVTGGTRLRAKEVVVEDQIVGDELFWGAGITVGIPPFCSLWCKADQLKVSAEVVGVVGDNVNHVRGPSPIEGRIGFVGRIRPPYAISVRAGTHLDDDVGAPEFRATIDLVYQSR
ncbi:MAG TPA: hypothetical protein VF403_16095 [Kofleriaceae bacterium]